MASSQKYVKINDEEHTSSGYLHNVTPLKTSKSGIKYFNCLMQEKEECVNVVCFTGEESRQQMAKFSEDRTPVKMECIQRSPSLRNSGKFDIKFNNQSKITTPRRKLDFDYQKLQSEETMTIAEIKQKLNIYQKTAIKVKIVKLEDVTDQQTKNGLLKKQNAVVADKSGSIYLTLWDKEINKILLSKSYEIKNVSARSYNDKKTLTTALDTTYNEIADIGNFTLEEEKNEVNIVNMDVISVKCSQLNQCKICSKDIGEFNKDLVIVKCNSCSMTQKTSNIVKNIKCEIVAEIDNSMQRMILYNSGLKSNTKTQNLSNPVDIESYLLVNPKIKAEVNNNIIVQIISIKTE